MEPPFKVRSIYEYKSDYEDDLSFPPNVEITVTKIEDEEWYIGDYGNESGLFPKNFVEIIPPKSPGQPSVNPSALKDIPDLAMNETEKPVAESSPIIQPEEKRGTLGSSQPSEFDSSSNIKGNSNESDASVSKPLMPNQKISDPYVVKKQFLTSAKSSYIPEIKPRESNIIGHMHNDVAKDSEIVRASTNTQEEPQEGPKMSLKERIALLQQRQDEERKREQDLLEKQRQKKQKALEEKEKRDQLKKEAESLVHETEEANQATKNSRVDSDSLEISENKVISDLEEENEDISDVNEIRDTVPEESETTALEANDAEGDSEDEELKRKKLVERMAKISGGRNMFGMMGMPNPFGAPPVANDINVDSASGIKSKDVAHEITSPTIQETNSEISSIVSSEQVVAPQEDIGKAEEVINESDETDVDSSFLNEPEEQIDSFAEEVKTYQETSEELSARDLTKKRHSANLEERNHNKSVEGGGVKLNEENHKLADSKALPDASTRGMAKLESETTGYETDEDNSDSKKGLAESLAETSSKNLLRHSPPPIPSMPPLPPIESERRQSYSSITHPPPIPSAPIPSVSNEDVSTDVEAEPSSSFDDSLDSPLSKDAQFMPPPIPSAAPPPLTTVSATHKQRAPPPPPPTDTQNITPQDSAVQGYHENMNIQDISDSDSVSSLNNNSGYVPDIAKRPLTMPETRAPPPPVPVAGAPPIPHHRTSVDLRTSQHNEELKTPERSMKPKIQEKSQAEAAFRELEFEVSNIDSNSSWWLKDELPPDLSPKIGDDLIFEVDTNTLTKRDGRKFFYKDYYILFFDLSQLIIEFEYESDDPRSTVKISNFFTKAPPVIRRDLLDKAFHEFSPAILDIANSFLGTKLNESLAGAIFSKITEHNTNLLCPIGSKSYGVNIYKNNNNSNIANIEEIRAGDILCIKGGKFVSHKGLTGSKTVLLGNDSKIYAAIITEYDPKKNKFKVITTDTAGVAKRESVRLNEMKSGKIRVFRAISRSYVHW